MESMKCVFCQGTGINQSGGNCPDCFGTGYVNGTGQLSGQSAPTAKMRCVFCHSTGFTEAGRICPDCFGTGYANGTGYPR
jgi:DnaJ-class molecular chaperone